MLLHGCENFTLIKQHEEKVETMEMKCLRSVAGYTLYDHKTNEEMRKEWDMYNISEIVAWCRCKWTEHVFKNE
jgi:hypothetical protein